MRSRLVLGGLVTLFVIAGTIEARRDAPTIDEVIDVASGVASLDRLDLRLMPEHGPLPRLVAALPAVLLDPEVPSGTTFRENDWFAYTRDFVDANEASGSLDRVVLAMRVMTVVQGAAAAIVLFVLGRRWFSDGVGLAAAALWLSTPIVIGFSHLAMIDVPFTVVVLLSVLALDHATEHVSTGRSAVVGLAGGAALLTRHSGVALATVAVVVVAVAAEGMSWRRRLELGGTTALVSWMTVWAFYLVVDFGGPGGVAESRLEALADIASGAGGGIAAILLVPWPTTWAAGLGYLHLTSEGRPAYLLGTSWTGSRWWYFPAAIAVRTTLPVIAAVATAPLVLRWCPERSRRRVLLAGLVPLAALCGGLALQPLNLGVRYALPIVALGSVIGLGTAAHVLQGRTRFVLAVGAAVQALTLFASWPGTIAGSTMGGLALDPYRLSADVDLGQDLERVAARFEGESETLVVAALTPLGLPVENAVAIDDVDLGSFRGWIAASAGALTANQADELAWLRAYCPVEVIGKTVVLYRITQELDLSPGPTMPEPPCTERRSSVRTG